MKAKSFVPNATQAVSSKMIRAQRKWSTAPPDYYRILKFQFEELKFEGRYRQFIENGRLALRETWVHLNLLFMSRTGN